MKFLKTLLLACVPLAALTACGGGDTEDRLDLRDPVVRFVHAAPNTAPLTLYRETLSQADATDTSFGFASDYFDIDSSTAAWSVRTATGGASIGSVNIDPDRGTRYTIVALDTSAVGSGTYLIADPYNKPVGSSSTRLRLMNASYNVGSVDFYMNAPGADIATATPQIVGTTPGSSGPASGSDSIDLPGGTYQLTLTAAGTKTIVFRGQVVFGSNEDLLLVTVPMTPTGGKVRVLRKTDGTPGTTEITNVAP